MSLVIGHGPGNAKTQSSSLRSPVFHKHPHHLWESREDLALLLQLPRKALRAQLLVSHSVSASFLEVRTPRAQGQRQVPAQAAQLVRNVTSWTVLGTDQLTNEALQRSLTPPRTTALVRRHVGPERLSCADARLEQPDSPFEAPSEVCVGQDLLGAVSARVAVKDLRAERAAPHECDGQKGFAFVSKKASEIDYPYRVDGLEERRVEAGQPEPGCQICDVELLEVFEAALEQLLGFVLVSKADVCGYLLERGFNSV